MIANEKGRQLTRRLTPVGCCIALLPFIACGERPARPGDFELSLPARSVRTAPVERRRSGQTVAAAVNARQRAALAARISATVTELPLREGDEVERGAVVARLDDAALKSSVAAARAGGQAAETDLSRVEALFLKAAATQKEVDEAEVRAEAAHAALAAAEDNLNYAVLRAPFRGTVTVRPVNVGDIVQPGATVLEVEGSSGYEVRASVDAELVGQLRPGTPLDVLVDGQAKALTATVRSVSPAGDPATHRFQVIADMPPASGLKSGLFARLLAPSTHGSVRLVAPESAVLLRGGLFGVFVVREGRAHLRWIAAGAADDSWREVRAGLEAGERVALRPGDLQDGQSVTEEEAEIR